MKPVTPEQQRREQAEYIRVQREIRNEYRPHPGEKLIQEFRRQRRELRKRNQPKP